VSDAQGQTGDRPGGMDYAAAGVSRDAAEEVVRRIRPHVERTAVPEVLGGLGGFGGLFAFDTRRYRHPVLVAATDGVGTKVELARQLDRHRGIGVDVVAMVVDDIVVSGARPLFFLDYLAVGRLDPAHAEEVVAGIADGCQEAGCALVGGETAEHPGLLPPGHYDVAGFGVGAVERSRMLGPERVQPGDQIVAMASNGLHANGYSLARRLVEGLDLGLDHGLLVQSLGEALLRPTRIYTPHCLALAALGQTRVFCHVTGGGIPGNLPRVLPDGLGAVVDTSSFEVPQIFRLLQERGFVTDAEMWRTFNMGAGMLAVVDDGSAACSVLMERGVDAWVCGQVVERTGVRLAGLPPA
jgi:phosphoribosylformylglycinamidine cyclo-ligase